MRARSKQTPSLLRCAFRRFHVREGKNARDQITSDRRSKHTWSDCILMHSIHSKWKFKRMLSMGHTCCACLKTTWRWCRLRATTFGAPPVTRNYLVWFQPGAYSNKITISLLKKIENAHIEINSPSSNGWRLSFIMIKWLLPLLSQQHIRTIFRMLWLLVIHSSNF